MRDKAGLNKGTFLSIAEASGLDTKDPYIEALYDYVAKMFPSFKVTEGMDLTDIEPMIPFILPKE